MVNKGKQFENQVKRDWERTLPDSVILRLPDQQSGYKQSRNISDFIAFNTPKLFFIECKTTENNTVAFTRLTQYESMLKYKDKPETYPGFLIWWKNKDKIAWIPVETVEKLMRDNYKSINVKILDDNNYFKVEIPGIKKRVFIESDYKVLLNLKKEDING